MVIRPWALASAAVLLTVGACGADDAAVRQTASAFGAAVAGGDFTRACALLAPATRATIEYQQSAACPQVLRQANVAPGTVGQIEVWGGEAQARTSSDTWFLTRTNAGWRVAAVGCVEQEPDTPYVCKVSGP
jgi:hypothetical protein